MSTPALFNRPAPDYTHRTWTDEMADAASLIVGVRHDLEVMGACAAEVRAGRTQTELISYAELGALELLRGAVKVVGDADDRYFPVYEEIRRAGGREEVAGEKRYHQAD